MASPIPPPWLVQPLDPGDFDPPGSLPDPGFTQLVNDTLGNLGTPADGVDQITSDVLGLIDSFGQALDQGDATLDSVLTALAATDPTAADNAFNAFTDTFAAGDGIVSDAQALSVPDLLELPMSSTFGVGLQGPPGQISHDFGTVSVGSPRKVFLIGEAFVSARGVLEMADAEQVNGDTSILNLVDDDQTDPNTGLGPIYHNMVMTPARAGAFTAQVNTSGGTSTGISIWTFRVTIVP